jgi:threonine aldolase
VHLDAARIFNAAVHLGRPVTDLAWKFDSVMFCLSKGLGAPVGSMLVGSRAFIEDARLVRKMLGGGMRQAGVIAAAGLIALEEGPKRLHIDHQNARYIAEALVELPRLKIDPAKVVTNILILDVSDTGLTAFEIAKRLADGGVLVGAASPTSLRMVTHLDVDRAGCERAVQVVRAVLGETETAMTASAGSEKRTSRSRKR